MKYKCKEDYLKMFISNMSLLKGLKCKFPIRSPGTGPIFSIYLPLSLPVLLQGWGVWWGC